MALPCVAGVFLGGRARRMHGEPKGLLPVPGSEEPIVARLRRLCEAQGLACVAVGVHTAYREVMHGVPVLADAPSGIGPLGGLGALLAHAGARPSIALACDMPYVTAALLERLCTQGSEADVLAPRDPASGLWQPLFARYASVRVHRVLQDALGDGQRSFQQLFGRLCVDELPLSEAEWRALRDWDSPEDIGA